TPSGEVTRLVYSLAWLPFLACSAYPQREATPSSPAPARAAANPAGSQRSPAPLAAALAPSELTTVVAVRGGQELAALEAAGFGLGQLVTGSRTNSTLELDRHPGFHGVFDALRADLVETKRRFPLARPTSTLGFRQFDAHWLSSSEMSFALVGVFNRLDRRAFYPHSCGEVRFVYRLRYETSQGGQPMS